MTLTLTARERELFEALADALDLDNVAPGDVRLKVARSIRAFVASQSAETSASPPRVPVSSAQDEFAWVIERGDSQPCSPTYWSGPDVRWSQDHMEAVRFARKQDAERVACNLRAGYHRICEHAWIAAPAQHKKAKVESGPGQPMIDVLPGEPAINDHAGFLDALANTNMPLSSIVPRLRLAAAEIRRLRAAGDTRYRAGIEAAAHRIETFTFSTGLHAYTVSAVKNVLSQVVRALADALKSEGG